MHRNRACTSFYFQNKSNFRRCIFIIVCTTVSLLILRSHSNTATILATFPKLLVIEREAKILQEDPVLIEFLRDEMLIPSSNQELQNQKSKNYIYPLFARYFQKYFYLTNKNEKNIYGQFIEVGAYDGLSHTYTIVLEEDHGWKGLLLEANPLNFRQLVKNHRKCFIAECCVAKTSYPSEELFSIDGFSSRFLKANETAENNMTAKCYPLYSMMLAANLTVVDLLTLSVGGSELAILQTLPWEKINVKNIFISTEGIPEGERQVRKFMLSKNYTLGKVMEPFLLYYRNDYYNLG